MALTYNLLCTKWLRFIVGRKKGFFREIAGKKFLTRPQKYGSFNINKLNDKVPCLSKMRIITLSHSIIVVFELVSANAKVKKLVVFL